VVARIGRCYLVTESSIACRSGKEGNGTGRFARLSAPMLSMVAVLNVESFQVENASLWVNAKR
jgi:hypothetical protein